MAGLTLLLDGECGHIKEIHVYGLANINDCSEVSIQGLGNKYLQDNTVISLQKECVQKRIGP